MSQDHDALKRFLVQGIASGIGLASESITSYKRRRAAPTTPNTEIPGIQNEGSPAIDTITRGQELPNAPAVNEEDAQWDLDEAQDELLPRYEECNELPTQYVDTIDLSQSLNCPPQNTAKLSKPVILPQRRPKTRKRGFIRAYAPALNDAGITQDVFLDFLDRFHTSTQASPWLDAINLASIGLSFIPHFPMVVGIAIQVSVMAAKDTQNRTRTNTFLSKANDEFFRPRNLYCLIMTYSPDTDEPHEETNVCSTIATSLNPSTSQKLYGKLRESSGKTYGEVELPEAAPLVFPVLDESDIQKEGSKAKMEDAQDYVREYFDKRAQAKFAAKNSGSVLIQGPAPEFTSRYADPNHPASSGSFRSLVTGGYINPPSMSRQRYLRGVVDSWCADWDGRQPSYTLKEHVLRTAGLPSPRSRAEYTPYGTPSYPRDDSRQDASRLGTSRDNIQVGPLSVPTARSVVKKALKKNILYLMVVNMPSDEELAQAADEIERRRRQGTKMSGILKRFTDY
ncbi:hypothetical protein ACJ41O_008958 [Fusarium nematophilum]